MVFTPITDEEAKLIVELRNRVADMEVVKHDEYYNHDMSMVAWLRAREHDLDKAESMFRKSRNYLASKGYDNILSWNPPPYYDTCFPYELCGHDYDGYPVIIIPLCEWDLYARKELVAGRKDIINRFVLQFAAKVMEDVRQCSKPSENHLITKYKLIFDLKGLKLNHLTSPAIQELMFPNFRLCERNFPESLSCAYVINAPKIFAIIFPLIKGVLAAKTLRKVQVFDHNSEKWKCQIAKAISSEELPLYYGGILPDTLQKKLEVLKNMESEDTIGVGGISRDSLTEVTIKAGDKLMLEYDIKDHSSTINWIFKTANYDIGFTVLYNNNETVIAPKRLHSQDQVQEGSYICNNLGKYTLIFDNTFSMFRSKTIYYLVVIENGDGTQVDVQQLSTTV